MLKSKYSIKFLIDICKIIKILNMTKTSTRFNKSWINIFFNVKKCKAMKMSLFFKVLKIMYKTFFKVFYTKLMKIIASCF